jgi:S-adenosylmethionine-diacylglycerol 3-amino-3-carboxypropyl transferase
VSFTYFNKLNYTLANEDTSMELGIFPTGMEHLVSVAGSGGRVLPLLAKQPRRVTCVDLSQEQLWLTELRFESARELSHREFLAFWGYPPFAAEPARRRELFEKIQLSPPARQFLEALFGENQWESILYLGKWERTFGKLSAANRTLIGQNGIGLFTALTDSEHRSYLKTRFPHRTWSLVLGLLGNANVFNSLLYKGHFPKKNIPGSSYQFYKTAFDRLFEQGPARENFFLQMMFFGRVLFAEGCPVECDQEVFELVKRGLAKAEVRYVRGNIVEEAERSPVPISALSFSDVPSYFSGSTEKRFMQAIRPKMAPGGLVVIRSYLRVPEGTDLQGYEDVTSKFSKAIQAEKTQMYKVDIYRSGGTK